MSPVPRAVQIGSIDGVTTMKKLLLAAGAAIVAVVGFGSTAAQADPSVTVCHSVSITVNDTNASNSACNVLPPQ